MARVVVADVLEKLDQEERALMFAAPKRKSLAARRLIVQVDVEQLAGFPRLCDRVQEVQPGHVLVRDFGFTPTISG